MLVKLTPGFSNKSQQRIEDGANGSVVPFLKNLKIPVSFSLKSGRIEILATTFLNDKIYCKGTRLVKQKKNLALQKFVCFHIASFLCCPF